ncbi:MAG: alginate export family protein [Nitrospiraceae bacterium]|nr:alginate export family protein [Nitrospiraceae bacterium]
MKKSIALLIGFLFILGFAATAFAIHAEIPAETSAVVAAGTTQITLSGDLRIRGWLLGNVAGRGGNPVKDDQDGHYDQRVRLAVDAADGPVTGRIHLESNTGQSDSWVWGTGLDNKPTDMGILEAWINYAGSGLLGVPSGIKVGHMPLALGPATLFFDNTKFGDDAIVAYTNPTPNTHLTVLTFKAKEMSTYNKMFHNGNDLDVYAGIFNGEFAKQELGIYYAYLNDPNLGLLQYPLVGTAGTLTTLGQTLALSDLGLFGKGNISGVDYTLQADFQFGKVSGLNAGGYGLWLGLGYKLEPVNVRAMFAYGSGESSSNMNSGDMKQLVTFLNPGAQYYTLVYDYNIPGAGAGVGRNYDLGIANTQVYNIGVDITPVDKLKVSLDGYILRANETSLYGANVSKNIGTEVDLKGTYQLTKNLQYFANAGVLSTGGFYKDTLGSTADTSPWVLMHGLEYAF